MCLKTGIVSKILPHPAGGSGAGEGGEKLLVIVLNKPRLYCHAKSLRRQALRE